MKSFLELINISKILLGPNGCPWDQKQTLESLQPYLLEELYEIFDAIDHQDYENLSEEIGDLFYGIIFLIHVAEKENFLTLEEVLTQVKEKLIRRHPHVFAGEDLKTIEEIGNRWDEIKKTEKTQRKSIFEGIPKYLPALSRAQKIFHKLKSTTKKKYISEAAFIKEIFEVVKAAENSGIDAENVLRKGLRELEKTTGEKPKT